MNHVLVISPAFFGYETEIAQEFSRIARRVTFIDERPTNSSVGRAAIRLGLPLVAPIVDRHFERAYAALPREPIDLVLVVKGESTPPWFLERIRRDHPSVRIIYYAYDRLREQDNALRLIPFCDVAYSFDPQDVEAHGLSYKPLFYGAAFGSSPSDFDARPFDVSFVGTAHSDRYAFVTGIAEQFANTSVFFYSPARWYFASQKYGTGEMRAVPWKAVSFAKMPKERVAQTFARSKAVVDLQRPGQEGLTMRTFEVLASGARLITSNDAALRLGLDDPESVLVVPLGRVAAMAAEIKEFVHRPRRELGERPITEHSLQCWVAGLTAAAGVSR